jgi:hypothetical protein
MSQEANERLARIETQLEGMAKTLDGVSNKLDDQNGRLHEVEHKTKVTAWQASGLFGIGFAVLTAAIKEKLGL